MNPSTALDAAKPLSLLWAPFLGLAGLAFGSFLNVCIDRLPLEQSLVTPASHCPSCKHPLSARDLVPLLSYLWLRGRCRYCQAPIFWRLPVVELLTGLAFVYIGLRYPLFPQGVVLMAYFSLMLVVFFIDLEHALILNRIVYPGLPLVWLVAPWGPPGAQNAALGAAYLEALGGGALAFILFLAIYLLSRGGMGAGDVKLAALVGLMLGLRLALVAIPLGFIIGGVVAGFLWARGIRKRKDAIPFGPFLTGAAVIAMFWGEPMLRAYLGLFELA